MINPICFTEYKAEIPGTFIVVHFKDEETKECDEIRFSLNADHLFCYNAGYLFSCISIESISGIQRISKADYSELKADWDNSDLHYEINF